MRPGQLRNEPVWVGGRLPNPLDMEFGAPPLALVPDLLDDRIVFCSRDEVPVLAQAAIAHAQFETIHPFADGNGRVGQCLIHMVMRQRRMAEHRVAPVNQVLAANGQTYIGVARWTGRGKSTSGVNSSRRRSMPPASALAH